ncbi:MAG: hypothetical protein A2Y69_06825 [Candidatus Aminicenantes bacterium RBG_13_59_9]|nr:MAG: hypothetical protein A2Y69_06825 [Candidatus Aminicenantes bacterium RBG_13_59_9]
MNFIVKSSHHSGRTEISVTVAETEKEFFDIKADTSYIIRVFIVQFGATEPWNTAQWVEYPVSL